MEAKSLFTSKTAAVGFVIQLAGAIAYFKPEVADFVKQHATAILMGIGWLAILLRRITHGRVTLYGGE